MQIEVTAKMVVEIPDDKIAADGTIVGSEDWTNGPTTPEDHLLGAVQFYANSTLARQVTGSKYRTRIRGKRQ
jgi:hypothetical protein